MTYDEAIEAHDITRQEARAEIDRHTAEGGWEAFIAECGDLEFYDGATVLGWLGY